MLTVSSSQITVYLNFNEAAINTIGLKTQFKVYELGFHGEIYSDKNVTRDILGVPTQWNLVDITVEISTISSIGISYITINN